MKITVLYNKDSGVCYHRLLQPAKYLEKEYKDVQITYVDELHCMENINVFDCDIVWYSTLFIYDFKFLAELKAKYGFKVVMDLDDYPEPYEGQIHYEVWKKYKLKQVVFNGLKAADVLFVTNNQLKQIYEPFTKKVIVVPNGLPFDEEQFISQHVPSADVRFLYLAGNNHEHDLYTLKPLFEQLATNKLFQQKGLLAICGYNKPLPEENVYDRMETVGKTCGKYIRQNLLPFDSYMQHYNTGDVAIAPLVNNVYNACRSNLKFLEAAAMRMPLICNDALPYTVDKLAGGIVFCKNTEGWRKAFEFFLKNPNQIKKYGEANYNYAKQNYNLRTVNILRYTAMRDLVVLNVNSYLPKLKIYNTYSSTRVV